MKSREAPASTRSAIYPWMRVALVISLVALLVRLLLLLASPRAAYRPDHMSFMTWADLAYREGIHAPYDIPEAGALRVMAVPEAAPSVNQAYRVVEVMPCNYPPGSLYVFWLQGALWRALDQTEVKIVTDRSNMTVTWSTNDGSIPTRVSAVPPALARTVVDQTVQSPIHNTLTARFVNALPGILADWPLALGVAALVRRSSRREVASRNAAAAFALTLLMPPIFLDSALWNQVDSWVTAPLVWTLYTLLTRRIVLAGVLFGVALSVKAQAVLLGPVLVLAAVSLLLEPGAARKNALRMVGGAAAGLLALGSIAAPFMLRDAGRPEGPLRVFQLGYLKPILEEYPMVTANAYNLWWLEWASAGFARDRLDSTTRFAGVSRDLWGRGLLAAGLLAALVLVVRRWGLRDAAWVPFAALVLLAAFVLPTRVHERYIYYCIPFLIAAAFQFTPWWATVVLVAVVGTFEMTWNVWYTASPAHRTGASLLAGLSVASLLYALAALAVAGRRWRSVAEER